MTSLRRNGPYGALGQWGTGALPHFQMGGFSLQHATCLLPLNTPYSSSYKSTAPLPIKGHKKGQY